MRVRRTRTRLIPPVAKVFGAARVKAKKKKKQVLKKKKKKEQGGGGAIDYEA